MSNRLVEFRKDDLYAYIDFENGSLVYGGNVPIDESAKMFIDRLEEYSRLAQAAKPNKSAFWSGFWKTLLSPYWLVVWVPVTAYALWKVVI